ncbi:ribonucleoside diphosphate reductase large subunit [Fadolivirus algeromassiliense]|jgi:ribonucleoside-diphosphate reductase alpha chain|uniref:Ribonucleoside-diphosphate reductase n=1 Tax=Fadolivirus FV1/VV64 TaxID=3070911 RepID=A0A7D3USV1_9VIRU|nr:ribonucleoside diphosphate reductase large subunit [Fadolivirus algeromassiliense]QKF93830.1 ribonucleoside diphosphate reductase large subunit [Fadolivirus FV1/VV64]
MNLPNTGNSHLMQVIKRDGRTERVSFDKILRRIDILCDRRNLDRINTIEVAKDTINGLYDGITTEEIDHFAAVSCSEKIRDDPQYDKLASALCVSRLHKMTSKDFLEVTNRLYTNADIFGKPNPLVTEEYYKYVNSNIDLIQDLLNQSYMKDYDFDYFGFKTLEKAYLHRIKTNSVTQKSIEDTKSKHKSNKNNKKSDNKKDDSKNKYGNIVERPQHLWMRVALGLNQDNIDEALETYKCLSDRYFIFGSPTLYNAGSKWAQCSSCFLLQMGDSLDEILEIFKDTGLISKRAGGIGISISNVRASGSLIRGTNGVSSGIIPMIQVLNWLGRYVNQGGRRNGAIACYLEPWHADVFHFCELRSNKGKEEERARDIFLALWIPDLFMKRVERDEVWSLMCPDECPGLTTSYGEEFEKLYTQYEQEGRYKKQVKAKDLWFHILSSQIETGMPYMLYKDNVNKKTNQQNLGVIQCSNLCSEIVQYTSSDEIAVCNLASLCLPRFVDTDAAGTRIFNFEKLRYTSGIAVRNLNKVIDINFYPTDKAKKSNTRHRPIGLGVQGLADVYCMMDLPYDSDEARLLNRKIFETIYFGALEMSVELAKKYGSYETFNYNGGCPFSHGKLQYHLWGLDESDLLMGYDWDGLVENVQKYGTMNSLLTTVMPTASTSQIMGNTESIEPLTTNVYTRTTLAGEFTVINKYLMEKLISMDLWNQDIRNELLYDKGSIQNIMEIPDDIKAIYKTAYEMRNKPIVQQSIERGPFIDQSQSLNLFCQVPDFDMLTSSHFYTWRNGLKTGLYYLKTQPAVSAIDFGLDAEIINAIEEKRGNKQTFDNDSDDEDVNVVPINNATSPQSKGTNFIIKPPCGDSCSA